MLLNMYQMSKGKSLKLLFSPAKRSQVFEFTWRKQFWGKHQEGGRKKKCMRCFYTTSQRKLSFCWQRQPNKDFLPIPLNINNLLINMISSNKIWGLRQIRRGATRTFTKPRHKKSAKFLSEDRLDFLFIYVIFMRKTCQKQPLTTSVWQFTHSIFR